MSKAEKALGNIKVAFDMALTETADIDETAVLDNLVVELNNFAIAMRDKTVQIQKNIENKTRVDEIMRRLNVATAKGDVTTVAEIMQDPENQTLFLTKEV